MGFIRKKSSFAFRPSSKTHDDILVILSYSMTSSIITIFRLIQQLPLPPLLKDIPLYFLRLMVSLHKDIQGKKNLKIMTID